MTVGSEELVFSYWVFKVKKITQQYNICRFAITITQL
jgi:hypothetical protein